MNYMLNVALKGKCRSSRGKSTHTITKALTGNLSPSSKTSCTVDLLWICSSKVRPQCGYTGRRYRPKKQCLLGSLEAIVRNSENLSPPLSFFYFLVCSFICSPVRHCAATGSRVNQAWLETETMSSF